MIPRPAQAVTLLLLSAAILLLRHVEAFYSVGYCIHMEQIVTTFIEMEKGNLWPWGPQLGNTSLYTGPLYFWVLRLMEMASNPALGFWVSFAVLELIALICFVAICQRQTADASVAWAAGLLLANFPATKLMLCENTTMAAYLVTVAFAAQIWAVNGKRARRMLAPGLLLGLAIQVQHLCVILLLPATLVILAAGKGRPRRLAWLYAACLVVQVVLLAPLIGEPTPRGEFGDDMAILQELVFSWPLFLKLLYRAALDPVTLVGLFLCGLAASRRRAAVATWAGGVWSVAVLLVVTVALTIRKEEEGLWRHILGNGARALLGGVVFYKAWSFLSHMLPYAIARLLGRYTVLILVGVSLTVNAGYGALRQKRRFEAKMSRREDKAACGCTQQYFGKNEHQATIARFCHKIVDRGMPKLPAENLVIRSPFSIKYDHLLQWMIRDQSRESLTSGSIEDRIAGRATIAISHSVAGVDLGALPGARDYGGFVVIAGGREVGVLADGDARSVRLRLPPAAARKERLRLLVLIRNDSFNMGEDPGAIRALLAGQPLQPLGSCVCGRGALAASFIFELVHPGDQALSLELGHWGGTALRRLHVIALP